MSILGSRNLQAFKNDFIVYNFMLDVIEKREFLCAGLIGCGAIGAVLAHAIDEGEAGNTRLGVLYDSTVQKAQKLSDELSSKPKVVESFNEFIEYKDMDLVIEAASQRAVRQYALKVLKAGKHLMVMSVGALVDRELMDKIRTLAEKAGRKIYVPSGAIAGLDGLKSAATGRINTVTLTTRKPPKELKETSHVKQKRIDIDGLKKPKVIYEGSALEACKLFPSSVNVAAALSLAGVGPAKTKVKVVADPTIQRNIHEIQVRGEFGQFNVCMKNIPSPRNPKTSYLAALSAVATLKKITENIMIGT